MKYLPTIALFLVCAVLFSAPVNAQKKETGEEEKITDIKLCELLKAPAAYAGKLVRVKATYRNGFEWSELYCSDCLGMERVWVEFTADAGKNSPKKYQKQLDYGNNDLGRTANVVLVGRFETGKNYGDGGYRHQINAIKLEKAERIYKGGPVSEVLPDAIRAKTYCKH